MTKADPAGPTADELIEGAVSSLTKLELRDFYLLSDPAYSGWREGKPLSEVAACYAEWTEFARRMVGRGVAMRRVRVVSEPVSDYISFEHAVTPEVNLAAGEQIRWLARQATDGLLLPGADVWIVDDRAAVFYDFSGDGDFAGERVVTDPAIVNRVAAAVEEAWGLAVRHEDYRPAVAAE